MSFVKREDLLINGLDNAIPGLSKGRIDVSMSISISINIGISMNIDISLSLSIGE